MKTPLIIEINDHWLKLAAVKSFLTGGRRISVRARPLEDPAQAAGLLAQMLRDEKIKPCPVTLCVSRSQGMFWNLSLPSDDPEEIRQMVELNVARIVPDKREQVIHNYTVTGKNEQGFSLVTLAVMLRDLITRQITAAESAGLQVEEIVLGTFGVFSMVSNRFRHEIEPSATDLILDIDSHSVDLIIFSGSRLRSSRSINIGSEQLGDEMNMRKLVGEIRQAIVMFHSQEGGQKPARMYVSGARAKSEGIMAMASSELGIEVKPAFLAMEGLPENVSLSAAVEFLGGAGQSAGMSFEVPEIEVRRSLRQKTRELMVTGALVFYLCVALAATVWCRHYLYQRYEASLSKRIAALTRSLGDVAVQHEQQEFIAQKLAERRLPLAFLGYLIKALPQEIAVKYVGLDKDGNVVLKGEAQELSDIFKFVSTLEKADSCKDVKTKSTRKRKVREKEITDFELNFTLVR
jgi:hypothetical protein